MRQFLKLTFVEFKIFLREPVAVFFNLFFPLMFLFLTMHVFLPQAQVEAGAINYFIPSFIIIVTTGVSIFNIPIYIVKYRNSKFLKRLRVAPVKPLTILFSMGTANLLMLIFGIIILVLLGIYLYGADFTGNPLLFILGVLLSFISLGSLGLMVASFVRGMRTVSVVGQLLYYPMLFLSGVVPIDLGWLSFLQKVIPITYAVDLVRRLWNAEFFEQLNANELGPMDASAYAMQTGGIWVDVAVLAVVGLVAIIISAITFKWE